MLTFDIYSPEEEIHLPLYQEKGIQVFVKRDDMIHPYISGNKWRKLKYTLENALKKHQSTLVTFGGAWSNHLLATACAGAKFGFRTVGFVRGEQIQNPVLALCKMFGMQLYFVDRSNYRDKASLFEKHFGEYADAYFIDEGGYGQEGALGVKDLFLELKNTYDYCFCACGTGTTLAGLAMGSGNMQLHGIPVLKGGEFIYNELRALKVDPTRVNLHLDYHFGGYAKTKPELMDFVQSFTQQTGILIEPTYTGKMYYALHDLIRKDYFQPGVRILTIHTGGLMGVLGYL